MSILLAQIFSIYIFVVGIAILRSPVHLQRVYDEVLSSSAIMFLSGMIALIIGILLVIAHNLWVADWRVAITIVAWLSFLKGITIMVFPEVWPRLASALIKPKLFRGIAVFYMLFALWLGYHGFVAYS